MNIGQKIAAVRDSQLGKIVLFPVRLLPAAVGFCWDSLCHSLSEWREWRFGKVTKLKGLAWEESCEEPSEPWLPNGKQH